MPPLDEIVAVVPARAGSQGIPGKNLLRLGGATLVYRAVWSARQAGIGRVFVSTDSAEIAEEALRAGGEVPALRPPELATSTARTADAACHIVNAAGVEPNAVMVVQPTSPLRYAGDLEAAMRMLRDNGEADAVAGVTAQNEPHPAKMRMLSDGWLQPFLPDAQTEVPRQTLPPAYRLNGAVYLVRWSVLKETGRIIPDRTLGYVMPPERSINLDHPWDVILLEALLERGEVVLEPLSALPHSKA